MTPELWQRLAAAEVPYSKGQAFLRTLDPSALSESERQRFQRADLDALTEFLDVGGEVLEPPDRVRQLETPPLALFALGRASVMAGACIGIVGTRNASVYGKAAAKKFASGLAGAACVVSGGALGIDAAAHDGTLQAGGTTIAVLACGVDKPYPTQNAGLFRRIVESGCLVSKYACGSLPQPYKFLERNEIIAALSDAVLVVEAPEGSGALSTATAATALGRPVFVVPGNIDSKGFTGSHSLIRAGATLVDDPEQILQALGLSGLPKATTEPVTELAAQILAKLSTVPLPAEKLAEAVGLPPQDLMAELTMLELDGRVTRELGGYALVL